MSIHDLDGFRARCHRLDLILPLMHATKNLQLRPNCVGGCEMTARHGLGSLDHLEFPRSQTGIEISADRRAGDFAHASPESIAKDWPLVNHRFALEVSIPCESHRLANPGFRIQFQRLMLHSLSCAQDDLIGLMTILGCK